MNNTNIEFPDSRVYRIIRYIYLDILCHVSTHPANPRFDLIKLYTRNKPQNHVNRWLTIYIATISMHQPDAQNRTMDKLQNNTQRTLNPLSISLQTFTAGICCSGKYSYKHLLTKYTHTHTNVMLETCVKGNDVYGNNIEFFETLNESVNLLLFCSGKNPNQSSNCRIRMFVDV